MNQAIILEARNVSYYTPSGTVLIDNVDLRISEGESVAIAGPNGAGKSTLLRVLAGLLYPSRGDVRLFGCPLAELPTHQRAQRIAFVDQREQPDKRLVTEEYVALGRIPHQRKASKLGHDQAVNKALEAVGLIAHRSELLATLSGGELQRAVVARALCQEPSILFLDEPTNHLDPKAKGSVLSLVASLGITTICVLHDLTLIPSFADQTVLLDDAKVFFKGPTKEALSEATVNSVFGIELLRFPHPESGHSVSALDIPIKKSNSFINRRT